MAKKHDKSAKKPGNTVSAVPSVPLPGFESPEQFTANILRAFELSGEIVRKMVEDKEKRDGAFTVMGGLADAPKLFAPIAQYWMTEPQKFQAAQTKLNQDLIELWGRTYKRFLGEEVEPMVKHTPGDPRFLDREWTENAFFDFLRQAYLLSGRWAEEMIENASTVDPHTKHRAQFYLNQIVSALSPSNFPFTNPEVIRTTFSTGGHNLAKGLAQLLDDMHSSGESLRIRQTDMSAFEVGKNLAITPGKVVYQNRVMQLIQYSPATGTVYEIPLLIMPPWINKYYILDLTPPKSFIKWLVDQGFTRFRRLLGEPGREPRRQNLRRLHARRRVRGGGRGAEDYGAAADERARLLRWRDAACERACLHGRDRRRAHPLRDVPGRANRFQQCRRPPRLHRRRAAQGAGRGDGEARFPRRRAHVDRVQLAAAQGPGLALHRQQLPAWQAAFPVRPALLECRTRRGCRPPITASICASSTATTS